MKKTYITIIVLVIVAGIFVFALANRQSEAPVVEGNPEGVVCTMDAKQCPDGSFVGRVGPMCEFAACPGETSDTTEAVKEFTVSGGNFKFDPSSMTVNQGDRVRIVFNNVEGNHDWVLDEFNARTKILKAGESETIEFVADKTGSFEYYCSVGSHRAMGMKGTLIVQ